MGVYGGKSPFAPERKKQWSQSSLQGHTMRDLRLCTMSYLFKGHPHLDGGMGWVLRL